MGIPLLTGHVFQRARFCNVVVMVMVVVVVVVVEVVVAVVVVVSIPLIRQ